MKMPYGFVIYLTNYCALSCEHCFWVQNKKLNSQFIETEAVFQMIDIMAQRKVFMLAYTGGDPLMHPQIFDILTYTRKKGMLPLLGISGVGINSKIAYKIYTAGVRCVQVSLDSVTSEYNDSIRGIGTFKIIDNAIDTLKSIGLNVNLAICLAENNFEQLDELLIYALRKGIYQVKLQFWKPTGSALEHCRINELDRDKKKHALEICTDFCESIHNNNFVYMPQNKELEQADFFRNSLLIDTDGSIRKSEFTDAVGNIYNNGWENIFENAH